MHSPTAKNKIRKEILQKRILLTDDFTEEKSKTIRKKIENTKEFKKAKNILFYMPIKNEVNILPLFKKYLGKKNIILPKIYQNYKMLLHQVQNLKQLEIGRYKIPEPKKEETKIIEPEKIDLILVPGIAFDQKGNRIGFGQGFYDHLLKQASCCKIAVAYDFQVLKEIPAEDHDQKINQILTENNTYTFPN